MQGSVYDGNPVPWGINPNLYGTPAGEKFSITTVTWLRMLIFVFAVYSARQEDEVVESILSVRPRTRLRPARPGTIINQNIVRLWLLVTTQRPS